jgi:hypothetical protein
MIDPIDNQAKIQAAQSAGVSLNGSSQQTDALKSVLPPPSSDVVKESPHCGDKAKIREACHRAVFGKGVVASAAGNSLDNVLFYGIAAAITSNPNTKA